MSDWRPAASHDMLVARAALNGQIRRFFHERGVLEVETPLLARSCGTDPNLHPIVASYLEHPNASAETLYLQTSPEFAMKRLLAAGSGPIFQLCKAFRNGESGQRHNPEFTMLEWYRPGFTLELLMDEVEALLTAVLGPLQCARRSYGELFEELLGVDPHGTPTPDLHGTPTHDTNGTPTNDSHGTPTQALQHLVRQLLDFSDPEPSRDTCLELLYSSVIEPQLQAPTLILGYPASQAALAKVAPNARGQSVARRFELVMRGMEIANGYDELQDSHEQARRFINDQSTRHSRGLPRIKEDLHLLAALEQGLPACAGVALGVDRLLMLQTGTATIEEILTFPLGRI